MKKIILGCLIIILTFVGCSADEKQNFGKEEDSSISEKENKPLDYTTEPEVITGELNVPWSIEKQGNRFYITERPGNIVKIENGELERQSVELKKELSTAEEAGLLGFVLAPDFNESDLAYAYYTYEDSSGQFNRIVTLRLNDNVWKEESLLLDKIPSGSFHHGGRLKVKPNGKLYATTGDASNSENAQDLNSLGGKILRINLDGSIPADNPFPNSYVYSYGHRNPQGITWGDDGTLYESEHGNQANDEINIIEAGRNYGWPVIEGNQEKEGLVSPLFTSGKDATWAPSGIDYYQDKLYVAALKGAAIFEFNLQADEFQEIISGLGRIRDIRIEDNYLYFISNNRDGRGSPQKNDDKLFRISLEALD